MLETLTGSVRGRCPEEREHETQLRSGRFCSSIPVPGRTQASGLHESLSPLQMSSLPAPREYSAGAQWVGGCAGLSLGSLTHCPALQTSQNRLAMTTRSLRWWDLTRSPGWRQDHPSQAPRPADPCPVLSLTPGHSGPLRQMLICGGRAQDPGYMRLASVNKGQRGHRR